MLYAFLKIFSTLALRIWCRHLHINKKEILDEEGPLLIAANHPNSFLDAILLCTIFKKPVYSLARGDAFTNSFTEKLLRSLHMFPIYRISEGAENLEENYKTFSSCIDVFKKNGIVLIFSEGKCVNEWNLRPLKKGTARLVLQAREMGIPLKIIPLGINYSSFGMFGKNIILRFGNIITTENFESLPTENYGNKIQSFNAALQMQLQALVTQIKPVNKSLVKEIFERRTTVLQKIILFVPAVIGYLLHAPLYMLIKKFVQKKFGGADHYDSVVVGMLFFSYPVYLVLLSVIICFVTESIWCLSVFMIMPLLAIAFVRLKKQV